MSSGPVLLLFGAGPRVGAAVAAKFAANGYRVATVSRKGTGKKTAEGYLSLSADLTHPDVIPGIFEQVQKGFSAPPSVIVYNAGFYGSPPEGKSLFALPLATLTSDISGNVITPFAAVQEAIKGWDTLPKDAPKTFIYTGNGLNDIHVPTAYMGSLSVGKAGAAAWIASADLGKAVEGARFFYADERFADGSIKGMKLDGEASADFYAELAKNPADVPWQATFVKGTGYVKFPKPN